MRNSIILLGLFLLNVISYSQDNIILRNGDEIQSKVFEITETELRYKKYSNLDGPTYTISTGKVFMIKFENGEKEVFNIDSSSDQSATNDNRLPEPEREYAFRSDGAYVTLEPITYSNLPGKHNAMRHLILYFETREGEEGARVKWNVIDLHEGSPAEDLTFRTKSDLNLNEGFNTYSKTRCNGKFHYQNVTANYIWEKSGNIYLYVDADLEDPESLEGNVSFSENIYKLKKAMVKVNEGNMRFLFVPFTF